MDKQNCGGGYIPTVDDILETKINSDINIEDGLSAQDDENLFLVASMAFLQQQLKRKLGFHEEEKQKTRTYSDMLLFETINGEDRQRFYIRLKDWEKFDGIKKSEIRIPDCALSNEQLLPVAKKPKLRISKIFRTKQLQNRKSMFDMFRRKPSVKLLHTTNDSVEDVSAESAVSLNAQVTKPNLINHMYRPQLTNLIGSLNSLSPRAFSESTLLTDEYEIKTPVIRKRMLRQQSKLSVCMEDESESENEMSKFSKTLNSKISYSNFPDELKATLSPEIFQNILSQMIVCLEEAPTNEI